MYFPATNIISDKFIAPEQLNDTLKNISTVSID